jgi:hypothetical protein
VGRTPKQIFLERLGGPPNRDRSEKWSFSTQSTQTARSVRSGNGRNAPESGLRRYGSRVPIPAVYAAGNQSSSSTKRKSDLPDVEPPSTQGSRLAHLSTDDNLEFLFATRSALLAVRGSAQRGAVQQVEGRFAVVLLLMQINRLFAFK